VGQLDPAGPVVTAATGPRPVPDPRTVAFARDVERLARRVTDLDERQADLDGLVRRMAEDLALLLPSEEDTEPRALPSWLATVDRERARAMLADLADWLAAVYLRYPDAALPSCWAWHPAAVEELWWLRQAHHDAFAGPRACWRDVADWHDRLRPGVVRRLARITNGCELALHAPGARHAPAVPSVPLAAAMDAVAERWATARDAPEPTEAQLAEATRHDTETHQRQR